jgi:nucleotide-binding universal stress UspA family protein
MPIVCATDFSPSSNAGCELAARLARRIGEPLVLLHAIEPLALGFPAVPLAPPGLELALKEAAEARLEEKRRALAAGGVEVTARVLLGPAAQAILDVAAAAKAHLIVVGGHGRRGLARLFLGSVAETVVKEAGCPVLVAREDTGPAARWEGREPLEVVVGVDGSGTAAPVRAWLSRLRATFPWRLTFVRVYSPLEEAARYGLAEAFVGGLPNPEIPRLVERDLRQWAADLPGQAEINLRLRVARAEPAEELAGEISALRPDVVFVGAPRGGSPVWPELRAAAVLRAVDAPVLCIPPDPGAAPAEPPSFRSVLAATDLSDLGNRAVAHAYALLGPRGGRVEIGYVHERGLNPPLPPLTAGARAELEARLRALAPPWAESRGVVTRVSVFEGTTAALGIVQAAERLSVDAITVASHGRRGLRRAVLGSVAEEVARTATKPVLVCHLPA